MGPERTVAFRQDAVRIALTSWLTPRQVADDLGVGMLTLNKWITAHRDMDEFRHLCKDGFFVSSSIVPRFGSSGTVPRK
jgi:hypothetical protein